MKNSSPKETQLIKPAELIFACIMILIISMTFDEEHHRVSAAKIDVTASGQFSQEQNTGITTFRSEQLEVNSALPIPFVIALLLLLSYGVLHYTMILVQEIKK